MRIKDFELEAKTYKNLSIDLEDEYSYMDFYKNKESDYNYIKRKYESNYNKSGYYIGLYEDESIKIEVLDDGKGIDFSNAISDKGEIVSLGLSLIRERAFLLGGDVDIMSDAKGTKITVVVPLNN